jgi:hypothetical protein
MEAQAEVAEEHTSDGEIELSGLSGRLKAEVVAIAKSKALDPKGTKQEIVERILESLTVPELKAMLKDAGKPVSGKKAELIARLSE